MTQHPTEPAPGLEPADGAPTPVDTGCPETLGDRRCNKPGAHHLHFNRQSGTTWIALPDGDDSWPLLVACPTCSAPERVWCDHGKAGTRIGHVHEARRRVIQDEPLPKRSAR